MLEPGSGNIFLVGPMGVGKSTVGRRLAERTGRRFLDSDSEIERRTGVEIDLIFEIEGEDGFRARETKVLDELTARRNIVLATGGGAVLADANREMLRDRGLVIYLRAPVAALVKRTARDQKRPLLQTADREARIRELLEQREPLYEVLADFIIDTGEQSVRASLDDICQRLES